MADISKIRLGTVDYSIKDASARASIGQIQSAIVNTLKFKGITTVTITNEGVQVPTDIYGPKATAADIRVGDLVIYGKAEYVWVEKPKTETEPAKKYWCLLDALNAYGKLASKDSASGTTSTAGTHKHTVAVPTWVGTATVSSGSYTPAGKVAVSGGSITIADHTASLKGEEKSKLVQASGTSVGGTAQVLSKVVVAAPGVTTATAVTQKASIASVGTATVMVTASATCGSVVKNATYDGATETLSLSLGAPSVTVTPATTAKCLTSITLAEQTTDTFVKTVGTPTITPTSVAVATAGKAFTYATGTLDATGTGGEVVTKSNDIVEISKHVVTQTAHSASFTGTPATISVSGTPKLKKSTAETINTTEAGSHNHTVTVQ